MQFHHYGYVSENPRVLDASGVGLNRPEELPDKVDVLIVGSGPAGAIAHAQLAMFPNVVTRTIERRSERLKLGQADGIQARSVETFQAFGFADEITNEAYQIQEMAFWKPDTQNPQNIVRTAIAIDDEGHKISEFPHMIVNQARVIDYFNEFAYRAPARAKVDYGWKFETLTIDKQADYPVTVELIGSGTENEGEQRTVQAKYVIGADGASSRVRKSIGGSLSGSDSMHAWGVMDILANTDFPDMHKKCAIQSEDGGNILHIPREGNHLVRMYVDLGETNEETKATIRQTPLEDVIARAQQILHPYTLDVKHVAWNSIYEVAHRLTDRFDDDHDDPRVFMLGDSCHTHSAKAGQGMNVSMQDGWNIAWKLGYVLSGLASPELLKSYGEERQEVAQNLINFDREWSTMMAKRPEEFSSPDELEKFYVRTAEFPAGFATEYSAEPLTSGAARQDLASGFPLGKRFKSHEVKRVADGVRIHLGHHATADGRFRIYVFGDKGLTKANEWAKWMLESAQSPVNRFTPEGAELDSLFDIKLIAQEGHNDLCVPEQSPLFQPKVGPFELVDWEKVYAASDITPNIFEACDISRDGAIVVVRPDHYVSHILPLDARGELSDYFDGFLKARI